MAQGEGGNNVAIIAIIVGGLLVAGAGFLFYQDSTTGSGNTVVERNTVIEKPEAAPAPAAKEGEPGFSFSHEDEQGKKTEIETN